MITDLISEMKRLQKRLGLFTPLAKFQRATQPAGRYVLLGKYRDALQFVAVAVATGAP